MTFAAHLTNARLSDMVTPQIEKRSVGIITLHEPRRLRSRATTRGFNYGQAFGSTFGCAVPWYGSDNSVRLAAHEIITSDGQVFETLPRSQLMAQIVRADSALITKNLTTTSQLIAEKFGKRHDNVVSAIEALDVPAEYQSLNFKEMVYEAKIGSGATRQSKAYELTRDGFALLVMGFTGKAAMAWKIRFLEAFNAMEAELAGPADELPFTMAELTTQARELLAMSSDLEAGAGRLRHKVSSLFSKAQHNGFYAPRALPAPKGKTNVRAHLRKLPRKGSAI